MKIHVPGRILSPRPVRLSCFLLIFTAVGCQGPTPPTIEFSGVSFVEKTDEAARYDVLIKVSNPNKEALPLKEAVFTVSGQGGEYFATRRSAEATAPGGLGVVVRLPCVVPPSIVGQEVLVAGSLTYLSHGALSELFFDTGFRRPSEHFSFRIELPAGSE